MHASVRPFLVATIQPAELGLFPSEKVHRESMDLHKKGPLDRNEIRMMIKWLSFENVISTLSEGRKKFFVLLPSVLWKSRFILCRKVLHISLE